MQISLDTSGSKDLQVFIEEKDSIYSICAETADSNSDLQPELQVMVRFPMQNIVGQWTPGSGLNRALAADWCGEKRSAAAEFAPVLCLFGEEGQNRFTLTCSETEKPVYLRAGVHEENGWIHMSVRIPLHPEELPYQVQIKIDTRDIFWSEAVESSTAWWTENLSMEPMRVPAAAKDPVYSSWYSFHQNVTAQSLEAEARLAAGLGFQTMILDDGWQTTDNNRGYAYCGDWEPAESKMGDMAAHVAKVHEAGLRYLLWLSVPFVGKYSNAYERFQDKFLRFEEEHGAGVLDLRYPEVRQYLIRIYERAVRDWGFDGLKLDFIDQIQDRDGIAPAFGPGMDIEGIEHSVAVFLQEVRDALQAINPDVLLEFRQAYIGPTVRRGGNLFRVGDCPMSGLNNRVGSVDIRLTAGPSAVHSDMIMWNPAEKVEDLVHQLFCAMFCTLQLSVMIEEQTQEQLDAIAYWVDFMKKYRFVLQEGSLRPYEPQHLYPLIAATAGDTQVQALYTENRVLTPDPDKREVWILNAGGSADIFLHFAAAAEVEITCVDCKGAEISRECMTVAAGDIRKLTPGRSGAIQIISKR